jgi:hypothetical protein
MRWLPGIERVTGHAPVRSPTGRWFVPVPAVERLISDPVALDTLAREVVADRNTTVASLRRDVDSLHVAVTALEKSFQDLRADVNRLREGRAS